MSYPIRAGVFALFASLTLGAALAASDLERHWPQWRGPHGNGVAPQGDPPTTWSETANVRYKVEIPGRGHASPVVWGDRIYLLTAIDAEPPAAAKPDAGAPSFRERGASPDHDLRFVVLALDRATGKTVWESTVLKARPHEGTHTDGTWASASAITDGERVWAFFGSRGIYCVKSSDGEVLWQRDLGDMQTRMGFGEGSTPVLAGDTLVINWDHEGESFIVALDAKTGAERWRAPRDESTSWSTPHVVEVDGQRQVVVNATGKVRSYDLATGKVVWEVGGMTANAIPTPVSANGLLFVTSGFRGNALKAIRLAGARGDLAGSPAVVWSHDRDTPYVPSPLLYDNVLYFLKGNTGILSALDAATGKVHYGPARLEGVEGVYASPVGAAGRLYVVGRNGATAVLAAGPELKVLSVNRLDDGFEASPAIVGREIYLRGRRHLYAIAETPAAKEAPAAKQ
ncbi:MAG TPA: PQQ-binding-like beta-propeller repeat protein [Thermoanaerobaculia bacterium]|nr:PQQ-binding-like beta-propeller repeat protein [Thermoanaerobaculia bacterium]